MNSEDTTQLGVKLSLFWLNASTKRHFDNNISVY